MSENITHTAVLDDCFRLMLASEDICYAFKDVGREHRDFARLGAITRKGDSFTVQLLESLRARWPERMPEQQGEQKLAFVLGWLCHRAADRQMKPVFREVEPQRTISPSDCSVYHDAFIFREVYAGGQESPYHPVMFEERLESLAAIKGMDLPAVEELFHVLTQRALLGLHTLIPDEQDIEGWMNHLFALRQHFKVDRRRYAEAIFNPDPDKVRRFIIEINFYDPEEPIIAAARGLQRGEAISATAVRSAIQTEPRSHYAQALRIGFGYLHIASTFFVSDMTSDTLHERLDIHKPGRDGRSV